ncbi:hypothetical protein R6Q59_028245 [Mikania micrantha]
MAQNHANSDGKTYCPCIHCANSNQLLQDLPTNKIANKYNESLKKPNGNNALVNELECLTEALGPMRSHIKGVGRKLKSVTPDSFPNANRHEEDGRWLRQEKALEAMRQQNEPLKHQMNYLLKATKTQIPFSSHQLDEDDEEDEGDECLKLKILVTSG